jgi:hypothetical protein
MPMMRIRQQTRLKIELLEKGFRQIVLMPRPIQIVAPPGCE